MFDIGWSELLLIGGVALVVIGPKDLPRALRTLGQTTTKVRRMASDFQRQFSDAMREADMEEFRKGVSDVVDTARDLKNGFNPIDRLRDEIKGAIDKPVASNPLPSVDIPSTGDYLTSLPTPPDAGDAGMSLAANAVADLAPVKKTVRRKRAATSDEPAAVANDADIAKPVRKPRKRVANAAGVSELDTFDILDVATPVDGAAVVAPKKRAPRKKRADIQATEAPVTDVSALNAEPAQANSASAALDPVAAPLKTASDGTP